MDQTRLEDASGPARSHGHTVCPCLTTGLVRGLSHREHVPWLSARCCSGRFARPLLMAGAGADQGRADRWRAGETHEGSQGTAGAHARVLLTCVLSATASTRGGREGSRRRLVRDRRPGRARSTSGKRIVH
jgi:hypothetical protein